MGAKRWEYGGCELGIWELQSVRKVFAVISPVSTFEVYVQSKPGNIHMQFYIQTTKVNRSLQILRTLKLRLRFPTIQRHIKPTPNSHIPSSHISNSQIPHTQPLAPAFPTPSFHILNSQLRYSQLLAPISQHWYSQLRAFTFPTPIYSIPSSHIPNSQFPYSHRLGSIFPTPSPHIPKSQLPYSQLLAPIFSPRSCYIPTSQLPYSHRIAPIFPTPSSHIIIIIKQKLYNKTKTLFFTVSINK